MSVCKGCGTELPPPKRASGRQQEWCSNNCRKRHSYSGTCVDCGAPTACSGQARPSERCVPCATAKSGIERKVWTREAIIAAIHEWSNEYGGPPAFPDWEPYRARNYLHDENRAQRWEQADGRWPSAHTAISEFGSWNAAVAVAGFEPRSAHGGNGNQLRQRRLAA